MIFDNILRKMYWTLYKATDLDFFLTSRLSFIICLLEIWTGSGPRSGVFWAKFFWVLSRNPEKTSPGLKNCLGFSGPKPVFSGVLGFTQKPRPRTNLEAQYQTQSFKFVRSLMPFHGFQVRTKNCLRIAVQKKKISPIIFSQGFLGCSLRILFRTLDFAWFSSSTSLFCQVLIFFKKNFRYEKLLTAMIFFGLYIIFKVEIGLGLGSFLGLVFLVWFFWVWVLGFLDLVFLGLIFLDFYPVARKNQSRSEIVWGFSGPSSAQTCFFFLVFYFLPKKTQTKK